MNRHPKLKIKVGDIVMVDSINYNIKNKYGMVLARTKKYLYLINVYGIKESPLHFWPTEIFPLDEH